MSNVSVKSINANFKRLVNIFQRETDVDYKAVPDKKIQEIYEGAKSIEVIVDNNGVITSPTTDESKDYLKVKLIYMPPEEGDAEIIATDNSIKFTYGSTSSNYKNLYEAITRFNRIAQWKALPEETRKEAINQYKKEKPLLKQEFADEPDRPISII